MASKVDAAKLKTKLCRHVCIVNTCTYGKKCKFAHHPDELRASDSNHEEAAAVADAKKLLGEDNPRYKTVMCRHILRKAKCPLGVDCQFAHSDVDLRYPPEEGDGPYFYEGEEPEDEADETAKEEPEPVTEVVEPCQYFWKTGRCRYGRRCKFSHEIGPDSPKSAKPQAVVAK